MLPTTLLHRPFRWAVVYATVVAAFLLIFEFSYHSRLDQEIPENAWIIGMGIVRDALFIVLAFQVLCWYRVAAATIKKEMGAALLEQAILVPSNAR